MDKLISMERIHVAQKMLLGLIQKLTFDFYYKRYAMVPVYGEEQILFNFSKPFASENIAKEVDKELRDMMNQQISLL